MTGDAEQADRSSWRGRGVAVGRIETELQGLHRHGHALARTLNLIVAPAPSVSHAAIDATLAGLGAHGPSRTLVMRRHAADRLDAEAMLECELPDGAGRLGVCHDQVVLTADDSRLGHAASLAAPLLLADLPTVLWLPDPGSPVPDPLLLDRAQHVLVDSAADGATIGGLADLAGRVRVHDLSWGRLSYWRAAVAAAFEPQDRRRLLSRVTELELAYEESESSSALLLAGWVIGRAGWHPDGFREGVGTAQRQDGGRVTVRLRRDPAAGECGGIESLLFRAGSDQVRLRRGAATSRLRNLFAEALRSLPYYAGGYLEAVNAAAEMVGSRKEVAADPA